MLFESIYRVVTFEVYRFLCYYLFITNTSTHSSSSLSAGVITDAKEKNRLWDCLLCISCGNSCRCLSIRYYLWIFATFNFRGVNRKWIIKSFMRSVQCVVVNYAKPRAPRRLLVYPWELNASFSILRLSVYKGFSVWSFGHSWIEVCAKYLTNGLNH